MLKKIFPFHFSHKCANLFTTLKNCVTITSPIFYLNSDPHIGHLYTLLLSDCIARWFKFNGCEVIFTNGMLCFYIR